MSNRAQQVSDCAAPSHLIGEPYYDRELNSNWSHAALADLRWLDGSPVIAFSDHF